MYAFYTFTGGAKEKGPYAIVAVFILFYRRKNSILLKCCRSELNHIFVKEIGHPSKYSFGENFFQRACSVFLKGVGHAFGKNRGWRELFQTEEGRWTEAIMCGVFLYSIFAAR